MAALRRLGFDACEAECEIARDEAKEEETEKRELKKKRKTTQMSEEDAIAMQQELFARRGAPYGGDRAATRARTRAVEERWVRWDRWGKFERVNARTSRDERWNVASGGFFETAE